MKTKVFFICLLLGFAMTAAYGQQDKDKNTVQGWFVCGYWSPVYCGDNMVDLLQGGVLRVHYVWHIKGGMLFPEIDQLKGEVTSDKTGEVFKIRETDKYYFTDTWYITCHYNLIGNMGTHYIGTIILNYFTYEIVAVGKTVCN